MEQCGTAPGCGAPTPRTAPTTTATARWTRVCPAPARPRCAMAAMTTATTWSTTCRPGPADLNIGICKPGTSAVCPTAWAGRARCATAPPGRRRRTATAWMTTATGIVRRRGVAGLLPDGLPGLHLQGSTGGYDCKGQCQPGLQACLMGSWDQSACSGAITPLGEVPCDKRDNNCDGLVDENDPTPTTPVDPQGVTGCSQSGGAWTCVGECKTGRARAMPTPAPRRRYDPVTPSPRSATARTTTATA
jgi:hypothetical protein